VGDVLIWVARGSVAWAFVLSAGWKFDHRSEFRLAFRNAVPAPLARLDRLSVYVVPPAECLAGLLLVVALPSPLVAALPAAALTAIFTTAIFNNRSLSHGCGCWAPTSRGGNDRAPLLTRNIVLAVLVAAGALRAAFTPSHIAFGCASGAIFGLLIM
jgi:hypothetical protein